MLVVEIEAFQTTLVEDASTDVTVSYTGNLHQGSTVPFDIDYIYFAGEASGKMILIVAYLCIIATSQLDAILTCSCTVYILQHFHLTLSANNIISGCIVCTACYKV